MPILRTVYCLDRVVIKCNTRKKALRILRLYCPEIPKKERNEHITKMVKTSFGHTIKLRNRSKGVAYGLNT